MLNLKSAAGGDVGKLISFKDTTLGQRLIRTYIHVWSMQFSGSLKKDICMYFPLAGSYVKILLNNR